MKELAVIVALFARVLAGVARAQTDRSTANQKFVYEASRSGKINVTQGQLAEPHESSASAQEFGHRVVKNHRPLLLRDC